MNAPAPRAYTGHPLPFAFIGVHSRFPPVPSTNGADNPSLGYSPRKWRIETIQGLKARHHPVHPERAVYVGPSALLFHYHGRYPGRWPGLSHYAPLARRETSQPPGAANRSTPSPPSGNPEVGSALQPRVARFPALPWVQAAARSLPRKGLCRSCPPGGWNKHRPNGIRFAGAEEECTRKACPLYTQCPNTTCHPFGPSAQPFQGCFYIPSPPMVAPRRCNHGLCGRIPLGFPEGLWTVYCLLFALPLLKNGRTSCAPSTINEEPTTTPSPPPGTPKWVLPCSPGLRGSPRYPGCAWHSLNNHIVVVPRQRAGTLLRTDHLPKLTPRGKSVNAQPPSPPPSAAIPPIRVHSRFPSPVRGSRGRPDGPGLSAPPFERPSHPLVRRSLRRCCRPAFVRGGRGSAPAAWGRCPRPT